MAAITFRSPVQKPLKRSGDPPFPTPPDPAARTFFRVTQHFTDLDSYWSKADPAKAKQQHNATDIGDFGCGSTLVAMAAGRITHHVDNATAYGAPNNAICSRLDVGPGSGIVIDYWHCSKHLVAAGSLVKAGQPVASVGNTGLGQVCHCHITCRVNGVLIDPEPLMFGGSIQIGADDDMQYPRPMKPLALVTIGAGNNLRRTPSLTAETYGKAPLQQDAQVGVCAVVGGEAWADKGSDWLWVGYKGEMWCVHRALAPGVTATGELAALGLSTGSGVPPEQLAKVQAAAKSAGRIEGRNIAAKAAAEAPVE